MFYSHFVLAKKGPLGTVWMAAHLERKLRKNQVTETNISASVDSIMFPEVPIALRLSGHLLLGLVRIYSKKVNYLYQDCSEALIKIKQAFCSVHVDLPLGATSAPFNSITLPETFEFDDMELEEMRYPRDEFPDPHVTTRDQITLNDWPQSFASGHQFGLDEQVPVAEDPYTMFYVDENSQRDRRPTHTEVPSPAIPFLEEDVLPPLPMDGTLGLDQMDIEINGFGSSVLVQELQAEDVPEREILRSAVHVSRQEPYLMGLEELGKDIDIGEEAEGLRMEEMGAPVLEEVPVLGEETRLFELGSTPGRTPRDITGDDDLLASVLGGMSLSLGVMPTPPRTLVPEGRRRRTRKKKQIFDEHIVLSNDFMKRQLENTDDIRRTRRKVSCSASEVWKAYRNSHMQQIFSEPSVTGLPSEIQEIFKKIFPVQGIGVTFAEAPADFREPSEELPPDIQTPQAPEIETGRFAPPEVKAATVETFGTPVQMEEPAYPTPEAVGLEAEVPEILETEPVTEIEELRTAEQSGLESMTPTSDYGLGEAQDVPVEEAPSVGVSVYEEQGDQGLKFLEEDSRHAVFVAGGEEEFVEQPDVSNAAKRRRHDDSSGWSGRTRAVAQYLQTVFRKLDTEHTGAKLSLGKILKGRTRKETARMFFETLVLKGKDYVEVEQEAAYADILLSPTPKLIRAKF